MDGWTVGRTVTPSYRGATSHLKIMLKRNWIHISLAWKSTVLLADCRTRGRHSPGFCSRLLVAFLFQSIAFSRHSRHSFLMIKTVTAFKSDKKQIWMKHVLIHCFAYFMIMHRSTLIIDERTLKFPYQSVLKKVEMTKELKKQFI